MAGFLITLEDNGVIDHFWKHVAQLGEAKARRLYAMAMNRKGRKGYTSVVRALAQQTSIKQKDVRSSTRFIRASSATLTTIIRGQGSHFPLRYFRPRQFSFGTRAKVWGKTQRFPSAFIFAGSPKSGQFVGGGHVFRRTGAGSYPIRPMYGPSIPAELVKDESVEAWEANTREILVEVERLILARV